MKKLFSTLIALTGLFILPAMASASITYSRTPAGATISNPVSFNINIGAFYPACDPNGGDRYWTMRVSATSSVFYYSNYIASTTLSNVFVFDSLPLGNYYTVQMGCSVNGITYKPGTIIEQGGIIFTIIEATPEVGSVFTLPPDFNSGSLDVASDLVNNSWELIALIIGIPLAFVVIKRIINIFEDLKEEENIIEAEKEGNEYITRKMKKDFESRKKSKK